MFNQVRKVAVLRPDMKWHENDHIPIIELPAPEPLWGKMFVPLKEYEGSPLSYKQVESCRASENLTMREKSGVSMGTVEVASAQIGESG